MVKISTANTQPKQCKKVNLFIVVGILYVFLGEWKRMKFYLNFRIINKKSFY